MMQLPSVPISTDYVKFDGGLDLRSPVLSIKPGMALAAMNYEPGIDGGYPRIDGFERFDGRPSPSDAVYHYAAYTLTGAVAVGNTITGVTSAATGVVIEVGTGYLTFTKLVGTFVSGETINVAAAPQGTLTASPILIGHRTGYDDAVALNLAADVYQADILKVNGAARPIRGVHIFKGVLYAFQDNAGGTAGEMFKSAAGGWTTVALGRELAFTSGGTTPIAEGNTITGATSAATATVTRVVVLTGSWAGGDAAGWLTFASQTGTFQAENLNVGAAMNVATIAGNASAITLAPLGAYKCLNHNFFGSTDTQRMYGCNGVNRAFEFDGTVFVPINTGMTLDKPFNIAAYKKQLFLSFFGSSQNSGIGTPYVWSVVTGAAEIGVGDTITGYAPNPRALLIFSRNRADQLTGSSVADYVLDTLSETAGAIANTVQIVGSTFGLDDQGIRQISRTQNFGNFDESNVSERIQSLVDAMRSKVVASGVYRARGQYRLYGSDGSGIIMTVKNDTVVGFTEFQYPVNPTCVCTGEDSTGKDVVFFGADNGYVYQADKGSSFDGEDIEAYLRMPYNNVRSPRVIKRYRKAVLEMSSVGYTSIRFQPEFSYGDADISPHRLQTVTGQGTGGYWDVDTWGEFFYDARSVNSPEFDITGSGLNMSLIFYSKSDIDLGHNLQGVLVHFTQRRLAR
jgi:hypothetical protein